jgi:hypothetical protein
VGIPLFGIRAIGGIAIAANLCVSVLFLCALYRELGSVKLLTLIVKTTLACLAMTFAVYVLSGWSLVTRILAGAALYVSAQLALRTLEPNERRMLWGMLRRTHV